MLLDRPLCVLDTETTGVDTVKDRIVQLGVVVYSTDGTRRRWESLFNPGMRIPEEATAVHGITDEMVSGSPSFSDLAVGIRRGLAGKHLAGYNLRRLDLPILDEELRRCGTFLDLSGVLVLDAFTIFQKKSPRDLSAAVYEFCGRPHDEAHGALADAEASLDVLLSQILRFPDLGEMTPVELADYCVYDAERRPADIAGKLYRDGAGSLRYAFGKNKDTRVVDDPGYAQWMLSCGNPPFPGSTCEILRSELGCL